MGEKDILEGKELEDYVRKKKLPLPPYNFTFEYVNRLSSNLTEEMYDIEKYPAIAFSKLLKELIDKDINSYLRIIKVDQLLMNLVEKTDNEIFYRPLPVPTMFIDNELWVDSRIIKGITVVDLEFYKEFHIKVKDSFKISFGSEKGNYFIFFFMIDRITLETTYDFCTLEYDMANTNIEIKAYIRTIICNILDMIYAMDEKLDVTTIEATKEQNIKRIERKQIPVPTKIFIKPKDNFKQYVYKFIEDLEEGIRKISHKFLVRGHWRHFRAERYKEETKENPVWIKPFWKGEGIPIAKEYVITK